MKPETQKPEEKLNLMDQKSDEEKLKEIIKKYSHQTKIYLTKGWWE